MHSGIKSIAVFVLWVWVAGGSCILSSEVVANGYIHTCIPTDIFQVNY